MAAHGLEWLEVAGGFTAGSSAGHAINDAITPEGCRGPALIASRVCDRLQGVSELVAIFGDEIRLWPISPRLHVYNGPAPALMVYLVSVDPVAGPTESSLDEVDWFIAHQANDRINSAVRGALDLPEHKVPSNIARYGNTSSATIPILVDERTQVVAGHGRLRGARRLGLDVVPTISVAHLTEEQKRAYLIADNQLALNASWDERLLAEQFAALASVDLDFSLDVTGFEIETIDLLVRGDQQVEGGT